MKKILIILILLLFPINIKADKQIDLYLFYSQDCFNCHDELEYLETIKDKYNLNIIKYEVSYSANNYELMMKVKEALNSSGRGVPYTVIGNQPITGFSENIKNSIENIIQNYLENDYHNYVDDIINDRIFDEEPSIDEGNDIIPVSNYFKEIASLGLVIGATIVSLIFSHKVK